MRARARSGPSNVSTVGPPYSPKAPRRSDEPSLLPESVPTGGSTSTSSTEGIRSRWRPMRTIGRSGSAPRRSPLPTRMAQWTDFILYSPYVGLGPSRKLDDAYVAGMASDFGGWHYTYKKLHTCEVEGDGDVQRTAD